MKNPTISRRRFVHEASLSVAGAACARMPLVLGVLAVPAKLLQEFGYGDVTLSSELHEAQLRQAHDVLMALSEDSLLKPFREMVGQPAPGEELGGWYLYKADWDYRKDSAGFAPAASFGQWVSALARMYAISGDNTTREKVLRLNRLYAKTIAPAFYEKNRFPAYCYDKLVLGLIDSHRYAHDPDAFAILNQTTDVALPILPGKAIEHGRAWRPGKDESWTWDESYTISENLFLAYQRGAGKRYRDLAIQYLDDEYYDPLAAGESNLAGRHAYSHVNSLSSAMQAYLTTGSEKHYRAAKNGFAFLQDQSFATGGWGPEETLRAPDSNDVFESLSKTHNSFETPCGAYAHFKLTRYLLRVTRDSRYGDSMERVMYNTILGAKPLALDGRTFYYSNYNFEGKKVYHWDHWPCCSGTYPQIAADYRISAYFHDASRLYVNLYIPGRLRFATQSAKGSLDVSTAYPFDAGVRMRLALSRPAEFAMNLRIPAWTKLPTVSVNGKRLGTEVKPGSFVAIQREWKTGDAVEMDLPLTMRLEPIDSRHENVVALLAGPLVLFPIRREGSGLPSVTREQLLAARKSSPNRWQAGAEPRAVTLLPFTAIKDEPYSTYIKPE